MLILLVLKVRALETHVLVSGIYLLLLVFGSRSCWIRLLVDLGLLLASELLLLLDDDLLHRFDWDGALHIDPLVLDHVLLLQFQDYMHATDVVVGDEAESSRFMRALVE